jgi:hypothetical protein
VHGDWELIANSFAAINGYKINFLLRINPDWNFMRQRFTFQKFHARVLNRQRRNTRHESFSIKTIAFYFHTRLYGRALKDQRYLFKFVGD